MNYKGLPSSLVPSSILIPLIVFQVVVLNITFSAFLRNVHGDSAKVIRVVDGGVVAM